MEEVKPKKPINNFQIVAINLAILAVYTITLKFVDSGFIFDSFLIGIHFIVCLIAAAIFDRGIYVLSAFVVVLIGFSTCVEFLGNGSLI